jgi:hypothetical protein
MNQIARKYGFEPGLGIYIIPGVGHDSAKLTPYAAKVLCEK